VPNLAWLTGHLDEEALEASTKEADRRLVYSALGIERQPQESSRLEFAAEALRLLAEDALDDSRTANETREICSEVFALARTQVPQGTSYADRLKVLEVACIGWLADQAPLAAKLIVHLDLPVPMPEEASWRERVTSAIVDAWLLLLRKRSWDDIDQVLSLVQNLRDEQSEYEQQYLTSEGIAAHPAAWELICCYHLAKAAEILVSFISTGQSESRYDPRQQVDVHFDRAVTAADRAGLFVLSDLSHLLALTAHQLIDNSLWTIVRGAGASATEFVSQIVSRGRRKPIFETLAPQRKTLGEQGLARAAHRAVVVSLPTSSGKTLVAEFRTLQALSLFAEARGWVAYTAPTRALVNQVARRLRHDLAPLGIVVERVSPALDIDSVEAAILSDSAPETQFNVLVTTPEKLDLMLRAGWEERIGRPLCLVIVDEAHNIANDRRGIKLELLLATINRDCRNAQFLLMTPFIDNAEDIAQWLDPASNQAVQLQIDWQPNDRIIALVKPSQGSKRGDFSLSLRTLVTSRKTLAIQEDLPIGENRPLGMPWSDSKQPNSLAAATSSVLARRGGTITLVQQPRYAWTVARRLSEGVPEQPSESDERVRSIRRFLANEFGEDVALNEMIKRGIGVHHSGLPDDVKALMEWMLEEGHLQHLVATTTIAQGVNFPVSNVVFASHQYPYGIDMPAADFWNIAGRAGRVDQGQIGVIALAAPDEKKDASLRRYIQSNVAQLNSTLVDMVRNAMRQWGGLDLHALAFQEEWSAFVQFLAHTYREIGNHEQFAAEIEQVLRGTLGFQSLRLSNESWATQLVRSVRTYAENLSGKPLSLVDSTGFSWESVSATLSRLPEAQIQPESWFQPIFGRDRNILRQMIGVMLQVPELRTSLTEGTETAVEQGQFIADVVHDWVSGRSIPEIARDHFLGSKTDLEAAMTLCCSRLFTGIAPTVAWGLSALQSISLAGVFDELSPEEQRQLRGLPAYAYYGVGDEASVALRLLGVPRTVAPSLARSFPLGEARSDPNGPARFSLLREQLKRSQADDWVRAAGERGRDYYAVWRILEGDE
jgi:hypothetical protein